MHVAISKTPEFGVPFAEAAKVGRRVALSFSPRTANAAELTVEQQHRHIALPCGGAKSSRTQCSLSDFQPMIPCAINESLSE
jgi:hypothetical protein